MKKRSNESTLKEAIQELLDAYRLNSGIQQVEIASVWQTLMGPYIAKETEKVKLEKGVLHIKVKSAALKNELMLMRSKIAEKINAELKKNIVLEIKIW